MMLLTLTCGCGFVNAYNSNISTQGALLHSGFLDVVVAHSPEFPSAGQPVEITIITSGLKSQAGLSGPNSSDPYGTVAQNVWEHYPYHFDTLSINIVGNPIESFTHSQLVSMFGPRPNSLDSGSLASQVSAGYQSLYIVIGFIILIVILDIVRVEFRKRSIHKDRLQEIRHSQDHFQLSQHVMDEWTGANVHGGQGNYPVTLNHDKVPQPGVYRSGVPGRNRVLLDGGQIIHELQAPVQPHHHIGHHATPNTAWPEPSVLWHPPQEPQADS